MPYQALCSAAERLSSRSLALLPSLPEWQNQLESRRQQWLAMLGLDPLPERTPLETTVTGILPQDGFQIRKLHFQPVPHCYVTANLYVPDGASRLPAILYECGHAGTAKCWYQEHPRWFAKHGFVCLIVDAIQIGECQGVHHGTYSKGWWHWYSQGYSPVAMEVWTAMRAADLLQSLPEVAPERLGITGNSGGGTVSWFAGAADTRFRVVAPSCQTGNIFQHIYDRTLDGHCDCSFWLNTLGWDFPDIASLIAPRPLHIAASTEDELFRPYAFRDLFQRVRQLYCLYGQEDRIVLTESVHRHGYTPKSRLAIFSWFTRHLKEDKKPVTEDIDDIRVPDNDLLVFPDGQHPEDDRMASIDQDFIPAARPFPCSAPGWEDHAETARKTLHKLCFRTTVPDHTPAWLYRAQGQNAAGFQFRTLDFETEPGLRLRLHLSLPMEQEGACDLLLAPMQPDARSGFEAGLIRQLPGRRATAVMEVRGTGATSIGPGLEWTLRRAYPLLGQTLCERQTRDLLVAASVLREALPRLRSLTYFGEGASAAIAIYAALLDPRSDGVLLRNPVTTHWNGGPEFLNVLRIGDLPHNAALIRPRKVDFLGTVPEEYRKALC